MEVTITAAAADKKAGMTLDELSRFVSQALKHNVPGDTHLEVRIGFGSQIQALATKHKKTTK